MPPQSRMSVDIGVGHCCCHPPIPCIPMTGPILTGSSSVICNGLGVARLGDIVIGGCGHTGVLVSSSGSVKSNGLGNVRIGDAFVGCFTGVIVTGSSNVITA